MKPENGLASVRMVADRILEALTLTVEGAEPPIAIGASIGIALFPTDARSREGLLRAADKAMYEAKNSGRNRCVFACEVAETKRSEEHTSELQSLMRISYDVFCLKKQKITHQP